MSIPYRLFVGMTTASLLTGFVALMAIVATNFWLGERAQFYFDNAIAARDTRVAACCGPKQLSRKDSRQAAGHESPGHATRPTAP